jgi:hypothetical protein
MATTRVDWDYWRNKFVTGDDLVTYRVLSEYSGAPAYQSIKNRAKKEDWTDQRKRFRQQRSTDASTQPDVQQTAEHVAKIIDTAEMLTRHIKAARVVGQKALEAMRNVDPKTLRPSDALAWLKFAIEVERLTEGLATERQDVQGAVEIKVTRRVIDNR